MPDNLIPNSPTEVDSPGRARRPGETLRLASLAPKFDPRRHQVYLDLLERALQHGDSHNIALTGAYGTGKSSVLSQLRADPRFSDRIVSLALSTISPRVDWQADHEESEESPTSRVNQIQKEIVKQLLYRPPVSKVPESRYKRATVPDRVSEFWLAAGVGLGVALVLFLLGPAHPLIISWFAGTWRHVIAYVVLTLLIVGATWAVIVLARVRPLMSASVNAALTTVTLTKQTDTYFDAYLDEIVYFFQATRCDIVVIEDIDRFEDAKVFDTLRSLNGLLNGSQQIGRRIVFVYAIRDSVFELIGATESANDTDHAARDQAKESLKRASRTKFFDVIIPVVPFISPDNARDVMTAAMKSDNFKIKPALIRLAARHVADMRMIHNIRNEFEIYRQQLILSGRALPDITDDLVFAIVLYKNTHLADFESIRHRDSSLDHLYVAWRTLVSTSNALTVGSLSSTRRERIVASGATERSAVLLDRLLEVREDLDAAVPAAYEVSLPADAEQALAHPDGWAQVVADDELTLSLTRSNGTVVPLTFSADGVSRMLGSSVDPAEWADFDANAADAKERELGDRLKFLRHHTWSELTLRTDISVETSKLDLTTEEKARLAAPIEAGGATFAELVTAILPSELARDLVRHGYITSHFALYASHYYGKHLSKEARQYIYRNVGPGESDITFELRRRDVRQILREQKADKNDRADLFSDPSILNISIVDYLLAERRGAAGTVARQLANMGDERSNFLDSYMAQGASPGALVALLAPHWAGATHYAATSPFVVEAVRADVVDGALAALTTQNQSPSAEIARYVSETYPTLKSVTSPETARHAETVFALLAESGAEIVELAPLNSHARDAALERGLFPITEANVRALVPRGRVVLAAVKEARRELYDHLLEHVRDFLSLAETIPADFVTATDASHLAALITDLASTDSGLLRDVLAASPEHIKVQLTAVPSETWQAIAATRRTPATFTNVKAYTDAYEVDESLAVLLKERRITTAPSVTLEARQALSYLLLKAADAIPSTLARVRTVSSLEPGLLDSTLLTPEAGDLVARLLTARLVADDETAFAPRLMIDWETMERTIKSSKRFKSLVGPSLLPTEWVAGIIRSTVISRDSKLAVINALEDHLVAATRAQAREIAQALVDTSWRIQASRILALVAAGAFPSQVIALLAEDSARITLDQARSILRALGGQYLRVADGGSGRPTFRVDDSHRSVLERFVGTSVRRVTDERFKGKGRQLVAQLM